MARLEVVSVMAKIVLKSCSKQVKRPAMKCFCAKEHFQYCWNIAYCPSFNQQIKAETKEASNIGTIDTFVTIGNTITVKYPT